MTDAQFGLLLTALAGAIGTLVGALKWAVGRITKSIDDNTAERARQTDAMLEHARAMTALTVKIDTVTDWVQDHTPVGGIPQPPELRQPEPARAEPRRRTPVGGVPLVERRARTVGDADR